jgi:radical SAM superfamily enzyme YgiQ (UPF0313 family)
MATACNVLLVQPRFNAGTFWALTATCKLLGARHPTSPLGLITVAALLPRAWSVRLVDRNAEELTDSDLAWADLVMTGGMLPQQFDVLEVIDYCQARGKPVAVGGPAITSTPEIYQRADFQIRGEAEGIIDKFIEAWEAGARSGVFEAEKFKIDVTQSPIPRFDLLNFANYIYIGVQFSRGCPFTCEFCDIIELYGRVPRTKTSAQMLNELEALYRLGYRGHVDFVDDNLIGNKKAVKAFLPDLRKWQQAHDYPFEFTTEASINLADDPELLRLMNEANFIGVFVGIESPDPDTLVMMRKKQNTRRDIAESVHTIYASGLYVIAGFIVGFDTEKAAMADAMVHLIEEAAIPICIVGLLYALPNTQLTRRLAKEGRLHHVEYAKDTHKGSGDQCTNGLNFDTLRPRREILLDYKRVLEKTYAPSAFTGRLRRLAQLLDNSSRQGRLPTGDPRNRFSNLEMLQRLLAVLPEPRDVFWRTISECASSNPASTRYIAALMSMYLHMGPFARSVIRQIDQLIDEIDRTAAAPRALEAQPASALAT